MSSCCGDILYWYQNGCQIGTESGVPVPKLYPPLDTPLEGRTLYSQQFLKNFFFKLMLHYMKTKIYILSIIYQIFYFSLVDIIYLGC